MINADGLEEVAADFARAGLMAGKKAGVIVDKYAEKIEATMEDLAPVGETRDLRESLDVFKDGQTAAEIGSVAGVREDFFMEHGTYKDAPQAFAGPSLDRHSGDFVEELEGLAGDI